jgi:hypothetical protein
MLSFILQDQVTNLFSPDPTTLSKNILEHAFRVCDGMHRIKALNELQIRVADASDEVKENTHASKDSMFGKVSFEELEVRARC